MAHFNIYDSKPVFKPRECMYEYNKATLFLHSVITA